ncbi:MAG: PQQ-like beta-propeller repeat protein [Planctomyces sp.]|nr:PQQ-like beta-propeller repeat protein [Planctomyces sp.]
MLCRDRAEPFVGPPGGIARITLMLALILAARGVRADWPEWRGPDGSGRVPDAGFAEAWPEGLNTVWRRPIGGGYAGIAAVDDKILTLDRQTEPREIERVLCVAADSGEPLWTDEYDVAYGDLDYGNGPRACPTIVNGRVYTLGALGHLRCLDLETGKLLWRAHLVDDLRGRRPTWGYSASPRLVDGRLIVQPGGEDGNSVVALDAATGAVHWKCLSDEAGYTWPIVVESGGVRQLVCWTPSHIRGVDLESGRPLWDVPYEIQYGVAIATPIEVDGLVLVCGYWAGSKAIRLGPGPEDATLEWEENRYLRGLMSQPLVRDGLAYLLDKQYGITCFDPATGTKLWDDRNTLTRRDRNPQASLVWIGDSDRVLALNAEGELVQARFTREGLTELGRAKVLGETWAHPAYSGRRVFARSDSELVCVELP